MASGLGGPKPSELRGGLGVDRNITSEIVPTASQAGAFTPNDKQNVGYSGTPMWKIVKDRQQRELEAPAKKIPEGFMPIARATGAHLPSSGQWYFSERLQVFWNAVDGEMYVWDPSLQRHVALHEGKSFDIKSSVGACLHEKSSQVRRVIVDDLAKAAQSLRMSIDHLDRPSALYALYEGHTVSSGAGGGGSSSSSCVDFCAKQFHAKLLPKLSAFRGYWETDRLQNALREAFQELDAEFADKHAASTDGCCIALALVLGERLVLAGVGDIACVVCTRSGEAVSQLKPHVFQSPDDDEDEDDDEDDFDKPSGICTGGSTASNVFPGGEPPIRWTRSLGDNSFKRPGATPRLVATPDVLVLDLANLRHRGVALICPALYKAIGGRTAVSTVFRRSAGRPRIACGALVDAAVLWLGQAGDLGLGSLVIMFEHPEEVPLGPPLKRARTAPPSQVRLRHILLKHKECKSTVDKVRNKQVKRTRGEAERVLRAVLEECESDPERKAFAQRCRELSECPSGLKAGDLSGDLGWVKPGKYGRSFDAAAFQLKVGQFSDLIDTEQGIHVLMRTA